MTMTDQLMPRARSFFQEQLGVSLDALLAPFDAAAPTGKSLRGQGVYHAIEQARRQDDSSLPMGAWEHDLKRADWAKVSAVALDALAHQSKDLQLAAWLLEAQINLSGFAGVGACLTLMAELCERHWDGLYPLAEGGDLEYRANIIHWINEKLLPTLRMVPVTATGRERDYSWADWEQARRNEQVRASVGGRDQGQIEGVTVGEMTAAIALTNSDAYLWLQQALSQALDALDALSATLDRRFGHDAPGVMALAGLLEQILSLAQTELNKRGVRAPEPEPQPQPQPAQSTEAPGAPEGDDRQPARVSGGPIRDRADAYARLIEAADFLMRLEPHSPAPYLVKRATEWGRLNTVELYQELFLRLNGQLNIFEMLGLEAAAGGE
jgi:type VI secretion system protein ImpA